MEDKKLPLVTIVTPSFNQGQFIEKTILSVLGQTYPNIEYIIVDGGSTDNTMAVVNKYRDKIDFIIHEKDDGQADAINKGFKEAKGDLLGWINSDDLLYPKCVERIVELYFNHPSGAVFYHSVLDRIDKDDQFIKRTSVIIPNRQYLLNYCSDVIQPGSFYATQLVKKVNYLNKSIYYCMDLDLWLRLTIHGGIYYTFEEPFSAFRVYTGTKTDTGKHNFLKNIKQVLLKNGANWYSKNIIIGYYYYSFKLFIKSKIYELK